MPAMTDTTQSVVNGMSPSGRNSAFANSGLVTEVRLEDFAHLREEWGELAGLRYQQLFEELAREHSGDRQVAPAQRVSDFVLGRESRSLPRTSYIPGLTPSRLDKWMPEEIGARLRSGIATFGRKMKGFVTDEAIVVGVESRTSTPVRIPRDPETLLLEAVTRPEEIADEYIDPNTEAFLEGEDYEGLEDECDDEPAGPTGATPLNFFN